MNEIIKVNQDNMTVSARDLHEKLEIGTKFTTWFERMCEYGFEKGKEFFPKMGETSEIGGRPQTDYEITVDMAKQICMIQRTKKGKEVRQYFIDLEKVWNSPEMVMQRALQFANQAVARLKGQIEEMKPKADFFDAVADSKDAIEIGQVAKVLNIPGIGRNKLFQMLREKKILMGNNIPYQRYIDSGLFRTIEQKYSMPDGETRISIKTLVYQKGVDYIRKITTKKSVGGRIKDYLQEKGIEQNILADEAGITRSMLSGILNKGKKIGPVEYLQICKALGVPLGTFIEDENDEKA